MCRQLSHIGGELFLAECGGDVSPQLVKVVKAVSKAPRCAS